MNNVGYNIRGHGIYLETGNEIENKIINNVILNTIKSWENSATSLKPAAIYISNPNN